MNLFRLAGDLSHVASILVLALRLQATKSAVGISLKTQELYLIVFLARYADLFSHFYSYYNSFMKVAFIASTATIIYTVRCRAPWKHKYDRVQDTFKHWLFAVLPCIVVATLYTFQVSHHSFRGLLGLEILWNFSILLEPLAIVPQLFVLQRFREIENLTAHHVFFLGLYRLMYIRRRAQNLNLRVSAIPLPRGSVPPLFYSQSTDLPILRGRRCVGGPPKRPQTREL